MAMVKLGWKKFYTDDGDTILRCKIRASSGEDALYMEVYDRGPAMIRKYDVSAFYWAESSQRRILLYDELEFRSLGDAREALTQWYFDNAPTLLMTLAG